MRLLGSDLIIAMMLLCDSLLSSAITSKDNSLILYSPDCSPLSPLDASINGVSSIYSRSSCSALFVSDFWEEELFLSWCQLLAMLPSWSELWETWLFRLERSGGGEEKGLDRNCYRIWMKYVKVLTQKIGWCGPFWWRNSYFSGAHFLVLSIDVYALTGLEDWLCYLVVGCRGAPNRINWHWASGELGYFKYYNYALIDLIGLRNSTVPVLTNIQSIGQHFRLGCFSWSSGVLTK